MSTRSGWRGLVRMLAFEGRLLITMAGRPEAVLLSIAEYSRLVKRKGNASLKLADLQRRFDVRLASLQETDAGVRLRAIMSKPGRLAGKVKAGQPY